MGLSSWLRAMLGPGGAVREVDHFAHLIPADSEYVTAGSFDIIPDAWAQVGGVPGHEPYRYDFGLVPKSDVRSMETGLLVLSRRRLLVIGEDGERWSIAAPEITDLDGHRHAGFLILGRGGGGLAVSSQAPVMRPSGARWSTVGRTSNLFSGWDRVLAPYGVQIHW